MELVKEKTKELLSQRAVNLRESAVLVMAQQVRDMEQKGMDVMNLGIGEPDFDTPDRIKEKAIQAIRNNITHYPPVNGYPELRRAIAEKLWRDNGLSYSPGQIVLSNGAKQALANIFLSLLDPGDEVLIPAPYWVSYPDMVKLARGKPVFLQTGIENGFKVTPRQIEAALTDKTKIFLLNSPSNPAGVVYTQKELAAFAGLLSRHPGVLVVSDEIYEHINYRGKHTSIAAFESLKERVAVVNGVSKAFAMTGWRIGYMAGPEWLAGACSKLQGQITSGAGSISQMAALEAMRIHPASSGFLSGMVSRFKQNRDLALNLLNQIEGIRCNRPEGAFYLFPDVSCFFGKSDGEDTINNSTDLCIYLLNRARVALVPGAPFGGGSNIRISYSVDSNKITEAFRRIKPALERLR